MKSGMRIVTVAGAVIAAGVIGTQSASATAPVITTEPGGVIRADIAPGEWWNCGGWSLQPPFINSAPAFGAVQGPDTLRMTFTPGADVWVFCNGTGLPIYDWNHIIKTTP
ncbi:hypothetical protein VMT65_36565 [Nocardia sp. CDC153]|uniref:hypothetical protein n=1 Tax=Nocardia sp. CDC153 TaxID=3112167 RepID=UPI002DC025A8|nr:hypothetical protein [Nocardia sp. CDC153]MEC3958597.1 hypothetical protein [Nocardia sp. CDC153]